MEKISIEEQKAEAIKRMKLINLLPNIIDEFEKDGVVHYSEGIGFLYWVSNKPEWKEHIMQLENKWKILVYHAELSYLEFGTCLTLFYVSSYKEEWARDRKNLQAGYSCCYVWNMDDDMCSEFGTIVFRPMNGGVKRIG